MMVGSANDAAAVIAHHISGSQDVFVDEMNAYARELGCNATNFTNVHGLHDQNQYTTARDMGRILAQAVKNDDFMIYFSAQRYTVPATNLSESRGLASSNFLFESNSDGMTIYHDPRVIGGRTGITNDGNRCLATSAQQNDMHLVCVVLGCESTFADDGRTMTYGSFNETSALYDAVFDGYKVARVLYDGQIIRQQAVIGGVSDLVLGSHTSVRTILPKDVTSDNLSYQYKYYQQELVAPISVGEKICQLQIWNGSICVAQTDLYAMHDVRAVTQDLDESEDKSTADSWKIALLWIGIGTFSVVLIVFFIRFGGRIKRIFSRRRNTQNRHRRRSR
jgi:D-alanyl-D-alanine carboxypeptidase (penicillin-binding protein 5/6)